MKIKFFLDMLKKEKFLLLFFILLSLLEQIYFTFSFYDKTRFYNFYGKNYEKMTSTESSLFTTLGLSGITRQSYLIPFFIFVILFMLFLILFSFISISLERKNIFLLKIKGDKNIQIRFITFQSLINLCSFLLSKGLYILSLHLIDISFAFQIPLFIFDSRTLYIDFVLYFLSLFIFLLINRKMTSNEKMIEYLREEY